MDHRELCQTSGGFCRFRHFELGGKNLKVLDEETPGGGLVAEFGHMVRCCPLHQREGFRIFRVLQSVCGCLHMTLKKNRCVTLEVCFDFHPRGFIFL